MAEQQNEIERLRGELNNARHQVITHVTAAYQSLVEWGYVPASKDMTDAQSRMFAEEVEQLIDEFVNGVVANDPSFANFNLSAQLIPLLSKAWRNTKKRGEPIDTFATPGQEPEGKSQPDSSAISMLKEQDGTSALQDLISHLEQGLERGEAKSKMSIGEDGLKSRQKRLRQVWGMPAGAKWADLIAEAQRRKVARGA